MKEAPGLNRRRFCGAAAATVAASPLGLSCFLFFTKEHSYEYSCTAEGQRYDS